MSEITTIEQVFAQLPAASSANGKSIVLSDGTTIANGYLTALGLLVRPIVEGTDLNSLVTNGVWGSTSTGVCNSLLNKPSDMPAGELLIFAWNYSSNGFQAILAKRAASSFAVYIRSMTNNKVFSSWMKFAFAT